VHLYNECLDAFTLSLIGSDRVTGFMLLKLEENREIDHLQIFGIKLTQLCMMMVVTRNISVI